MGSILVVLVAAVDGEDGAERAHRVRRIGDLEAIAVVERGPRLSMRATVWLPFVMA